jgi:hypothetical protein
MPISLRFEILDQKGIFIPMANNETRRENTFMSSMDFKIVPLAVGGIPDLLPFARSAKDREP